MCCASPLLVFNVYVTFVTVTVHVFCMSSYGAYIYVKFHENMSSGFKVMEPTQKLLGQ